MSNVLRIALPVGSLSLFVACDDAPAPPPAPPVPAVAPPPLAADPVSAAPTGGFSAIKSRDGVLRVAADPDAAPFLAKSGTGYEGFEFAIMQSLADATGLKLEIVPGKFDELPGIVSSGKADLAMGQMSPSAAYDDLAFSVSYLQYSMCLVGAKGSPIHTMADLKGKKVGMYDDPVVKQLTNILVGASYEQVLFDDYGYFEKLVRGQLDAVVYDCPLARHEMKTYGDQLVVLNDALNVTTYNAAVRKADLSLLKDVNNGLRELGEQGFLATLEERFLATTAQKGSFETASGKVVVVAKGDTLGTLAARELGSADRWQELYDRNKDVVGPDPDVIYAGMKLRLPK